MGKTSVTSKLNFPGRIGWMAMECPGFLTLLYIMNTLPQQQGIADLPWQNKVLAGFFVLHYSYRAVIFPWIQPSMSPLHVLVWAFGLTFQLFNGACLGCFLAGHGPTTAAAWSERLAPFPTVQFALGAAVFFAGLAANYYHDDELRNIRRREQARQDRLAREQQQQSANGSAPGKKVSVEKHYQIPQAGLFKYVLYSHYFVEWIEWTGFWIACGWACVPARCFVVNEVAAMLPRAVRGRKWYADRFGEEKIRGRWAVLPGVV